jgi:5'-nucleotidase
MALVATTAAFAPTIATGCAPQSGETINLDQQTVRLRIIHTSDIHSRLFPYEYTPLTPDKAAGLQDGKGPYGGIARMAYVINSLRASADRAVHLNGGDVFEGAPIFNYFSGEAEVKALAATGVDAMVIANHEFDRGAQNIFTQFSQWADFPILAANYLTADPSFSGNPDLGALFRPFTILDVKGLRVAVIGMGNLSTITSIFDQPNSNGLLPYTTREIAQFYIDLVRPQADLVVVITHLGLDEDQQMITQTEGIDVVLGGHNHIVVSPPQEVYDCGGDGSVDIGHIAIPSGPTGDTPFERPCHPRKVLLMHSGAFAKFVGQLDVEVTNNKDKVQAAAGKTKDAAGNDWYDPVNGFEIIAHDQAVIPIDRDVPEDRYLTSVLEPYKQALAQVGNLDLLVGYAPAIIQRTAPSGGDSSLGNLIATSMLLRLGVQTDFSLSNTTGIRSDLPQGAVTIEQMFNVFPFDNTITKMQVSGQEVYELFDYVARRSASRACVSQVQIAGSFIVLNCQACDITNYRPDLIDSVTPCAEQVFIGYEPGPNNTCSKDSDCVPGSSEGDPKIRYACDIANGVCRNKMDRNGSYELATSNYLAGGGSGFRVLQRNTTQFNTQINMRDAVIDYSRYGKPCGWQNGSSDGSKPAGLPTCMTDADCGGEYVCSCYDNVGLDTTGATITCPSTSAACTSGGQCVLRSCRNDLASFHDDRDCAGLTGDTLTSCRQTVCKQSGEQCKLLACIDGSIGARVDGRVVMLGR